MAGCGVLHNKRRGETVMSSSVSVSQAVGQAVSHGGKKVRQDDKVRKGGSEGMKINAFVNLGVSAC
jgi:hypothetical protein